MDFRDAIGIILKHEGGYVNDPKDPGGETNFGIAKKYHPNEDIANMTVDRAMEIYKEHYWDKFGIQELPGSVRLAYFDCCVNQGGAAAAKLLQRAVGVADDGVIGPVTKAKVQGYSSKMLVRNFLAERALRYAGTRNFDRFGKGWMRRLMEVAADSAKG